MSEVDVFGGNYTFIDWELYELWINGLSVPEALSVLRERGIFQDYPNASSDLVVSDLNDHYRLYLMLENMLLTYGKFSEQLSFQIDFEAQTKWIERYYALDNKLCRELLGKKLSSRMRKDLDEVSEKTGIPLKSCRRQFDNIKRIFKCVEEMPGCYVHNIVTQFNISRQLAERYATLVFVGSFRFEIAKRKLNHYSFDAFKNVSLILIDQWIDIEDNYEPTLDRDFLSSLRDLRSIVERDKEHRNIVCSRMQKYVTTDQPSQLKPKYGGSEGKLSNVVIQVHEKERLSPRTYLELEANFKHLTRNIIGIAQGLYSNKELKDFFVHLVEKIVEPLRSIQASKDEVRLFLRLYTEAITENILLIDMEVKATFKKYMMSLTPSVLELYN